MNTHKPQLIKSRKALSKEPHLTLLLFMTFLGL